MNGIYKTLEELDEHISRALRSTDDICSFRYPVDMDEFLAVKMYHYKKANALDDIGRPLAISHFGPLPHSPEFSKLLPSLEFQFYRRDPLNDWGLVSVSFIDGFLVVSSHWDSSRVTSFVNTESVIPLAYEGLEIRLLLVRFR